MSKCTESGKSQGRRDREAFWRGHIERCESLGVTIAGYCRQQHIAAASYHWWKRELVKRGDHRASARDGVSSVPCGTSPTLPFAEMRVVSPGASAADEATPAIEVALAGGRRVGVRPGFDAATLAQVLRVVEAAGC